MKNKIVRTLVIGISLSLNLFLLIILFTPLTEQLYKPLIVNEEPEKSEVIVILSAGCYESALPDFRTLTRLTKGMELYNSSWADTIICAGGTCFNTENKSIARIMKETLVFFGVSRENILIQDETINTFNDITYLLNKFKSDYDFNSAIFVTSSFHTYRTKKVLEKKQIRATVVSAEPYELNPEAWSERIDLFKVVAREYAAICYFKVRGWI